MMWSALGGIVAGFLVGILVGLRLPHRGGSRSAVRRERVDDSAWNDPRFWSEEAEQIFGRARRLARREMRTGLMRKQESCLLSFQDVVADRLLESREIRLRSIPLSRVVGSVDKPCSFTKSFFPSSDAQRGRWKRAYAVAHSLTGYEPIHVYQLSEDFFVVDGHFRVSVAKILGGDTIDAFVEAWD